MDIPDIAPTKTDYSSNTGPALFKRSRGTNQTQNAGDSIQYRPAGKDSHASYNTEIYSPRPQRPPPAVNPAADLLETQVQNPLERKPTIRRKKSSQDSPPPAENFTDVQKRNPLKRQSAIRHKKTSQGSPPQLTEAQNFAQRIKSTWGQDSPPSGSLERMIPKGKYPAHSPQEKTFASQPAERKAFYQPSTYDAETLSRKDSTEELLPSYSPTETSQASPPQASLNSPGLKAILRQPEAPSSHTQKSVRFADQPSIIPQENPGSPMSPTRDPSLPYPPDQPGAPYSNTHANQSSAIPQENSESPMNSPRDPSLPYPPTNALTPQEWLGLGASDVAATAGTIEVSS
jgi:hypothetical protein